jgi:hypothetical protein
LELWEVNVVGLNILGDQVVEIFLGNMSGMGILEETDASDIPFVIFEWMRKDVGFEFEYLVIKEIVVLPVGNPAGSSELGDSDPSNDFLLLVLHGVHLDGRLIDFFQKFLVVILRIEPPFAFLMIDEGDIIEGAHEFSEEGGDLSFRSDGV